MRSGFPEKLRLAVHRIRRRRWLTLGIAWGICLIGWLALMLVPGRSGPVALSLVLLSGAIVGSIIPLVISQFNSIFAIESQLERATGLPVIGVIAPIRMVRRARWFSLGVASLGGAYLLLLLRVLL